MFSGKSGRLIGLVDRSKRARRNVLVFKHSFDNRFSVSSVDSHNGHSVEAISVMAASEIWLHVGHVHSHENPVHAVAIDEAQFFMGQVTTPATGETENELVWVVRYLLSIGIDVLIAGLDQDFRGKVFGPMGELLALADTKIGLTAVCVKCGQDATRTQRLVDGLPAFADDPLIVVGASEAYEARCADCHHVSIRLLRS